MGQLLPLAATATFSSDGVWKAWKYNAVLNDTSLVLMLTRLFYYLTWYWKNCSLKSYFCFQFIIKIIMNLLKLNIIGLSNVLFILSVSLKYLQHIYTEFIRSLRNSFFSFLKDLGSNSFSVKSLWHTLFNKDYSK